MNCWNDMYLDKQVPLTPMSGRDKRLTKGRRLQDLNLRVLRHLISSQAP